MNKVIDKLQELYEVFHKTTCDYECSKCVLGKAFEDEIYKNKNLCDVLEDVYDLIKEEK
jgi:hypothetical protein